MAMLEVRSEYHIIQQYLWAQIHPFFSSIAASFCSWVGGLEPVQATISQQVHPEPSMYTNTQTYT